MILGTGIDIVEVKRMEKCASSFSYLRRIFSEAEIEILKEKKFALQSIAGKFSAKEATLKALGISISLKRLREIEILREHTRPIVKVTFSEEKLMKLVENSHFWISISHERDYAIAQAIWEG